MKQYKFHFKGDAERPWHERTRMIDEGAPFSDAKYRKIDFVITCTEGVAKLLEETFGMAGDGCITVKKIAAVAAIDPNELTPASEIVEQFL